MKYGTRRQAITWLCIISLIAQSGCASTASKPSPEQKIAEPGTVGIANAGFEPAIVLEGINPGKGTAALKGAGTWAWGSIQGGCGTGGGDPYARAVACALGIAMAVPAAGVGAIVGAVKAEPSEKIEKIKAETHTAFSELRIQEALRDHVVKYAREETAFPVVTVEEIGPVSSDEQPTYEALSRQKVDTVLEVSVLSIETAGGGGPDPDIMLDIRARARLVKVKDGGVLAVQNYEFRSETYTISEWAADSAKRFRDVLERGYKEIAEEMVDEMFLLYYPAGPKPISDSHGSQASGNSRLEARQADSSFPPYILRAESPEVRRCYVFCDAGPAWYEFVKIKDLQPTLRWESFPRPFDLDTSEARKQINDVTYELKVFRATPAGPVSVPGDQIYLRRGLSTPYHQLQQPLEAGANYFWTVRARFKLDSQYRVTEWAGLYPAQMDPWFLRQPHSERPSVTRMGPSWFYYRFKTPSP